MRLIKSIREKYINEIGPFACKAKDIFYHFKLFCRGERIYRNICKTHQNPTILYSGSASNGDYYLLSLVLGNFIDRFGDNYVFVIPNNVSSLVKALDAYKNTIVLNREDFFSIVFYMHFDKTHDVNAYDMSHWILFNSRDYLLNSPKLEVQYLNKISDTEISCIDPHRTVLLSPYEQTVSILGEKRLPIEFWERLAMTLSKMGYKVLTNCSGASDEPLIKGTQGCFPKFEGIHSFVESCGFFVGIRSGLADIIATTKAKKIVLYPSMSFLNWSSLTKIFGSEYNVQELIVKDNWEITLDEIVKEIEGK